MMTVFFCEETHQIYLRSTDNNLSAVSLKLKSDGLWQTKKKLIKCQERPIQCRLAHINILMW